MVYSRFIRMAPVLILVYIERVRDYEIEKDILSTGMCVKICFWPQWKKAMEFAGKQILCGISLGKPGEMVKHEKVVDEDQYLNIVHR